MGITESSIIPYHQSRLFQGMELKLKLVFPVLVLLQLISSITTAKITIAKQSCRSSCGNIDIPFPFGMDKQECFLNDWYEVVCQNDVPRLNKTDMEIFNIGWNQPSTTLSPGLLNVSFPITYATQKCAGVNIPQTQLEFSPFVISSTNVFVAVGCDILTTLDDTKSAIVGCRSVCWENTTNNVAFGRVSDCSGTNGCCQTPIPSYLQDFNIQFQQMIRNGTNQTTLESSSTDPCGSASAFLVDQDGFLPNITDLSSTKSVPMMLNWGIPKNTDIGIYLYDPNYDVGSSSYGCMHDIDGRFYCNCVTNYDGNPYLVHGCQDINECEDPTLNNCRHRCINKPGGYSCSDPGRTLKLVLIAISGGVGALILLMSGSWLYKFIKTRNQLRLQNKLFKQNGGLLLQQQLSSPEGNVNRSKHFCLQELERATDNFNEDRVLGRGGQGTVYKGMLKDGRIVAVKKPKSLDVDEANVEQFINEIFILSQINHRNVVKLLGCCLDTKFPLLVYEFIPNGTLYQYLHDRRDDLPFTWDVRLRVATEVAGALSYLHSAASIPIYHKDIKTMNILLDDKYQAKIADFGTSKSVSLDQTHVTTMVQGTFGYLDPEFFQSGQFTDKSDVYSFGVVLIELLTRQKPSSSSRVHGGVGLATHFVISMEEDCVLDIVDAELLNLGNKEEIMAVADLARRCLDLSGRKRPAMKEVAMELYGIRKSQQQQSEDQRGEFEEVEAIEACNTGFTSRRSKSKAEVMLLMDSHPFLTTDTIC